MINAKGTVSSQQSVWPMVGSKHTSTVQSRWVISKGGSQGEGRRNTGREEGGKGGGKERGRKANLLELS